MKFRVLCSSIFLLLTVVFAVGQDNNSFAALNGRHGGMGHTLSSVGGIVCDISGQPVRNARIELRTVSTAQTVASGYTLPNGTFEFSDLPPGNYEVIAIAGVNEARQRLDLA